MGPFQRRLLKVVLAIVDRPKLTLAICLLALAGCVGAALLHLRIDTDEDQLFSPNVPFFRDYLNFEDKFPENEAAYIIIEPTEARANPAISQWTGAADAIAARLNSMRQLVISATAGIDPNALGAQGILYDSPQSLHDDFEQAKDFARLAQLWGRPNMVTALLGRTPIERFLHGVALAPPGAGRREFVAAIADNWREFLRDSKAKVLDLNRYGASSPLDLGYDYEPDKTDPSRHLLLVQVYLADLGDNSTVSEYEQVQAIRDAAHQAAAGYPEFSIGVTGRPVLDADEMVTSNTDSTRAEIVALIVVFIGLSLTLRSVWLAFAAEISLAIAIGWTFGWATGTVGELNLLSLVFLITLIGIGMDYLVQILTRYRREAKRYERPAAIWARVFRYVSPPICTACLGAAGAFFVSIFTAFRGAAELGIIAGGGLLLCLLAGYTVLPALLVLFPPKLRRVEPESRYTPFKPRRPIKRLVLPALWVAMLAIVAPFISEAHFDPNLLDLQAQNLQSVQLIHKLQTWSAVAMSKDLKLLRQVRDAVQASPTVESTDSILTAWDNYHWLGAHQSELPKIDWSSPTAVQPGDLPAIAKAAAALGENDFAKALLAANPDVAAARLTQWQQGFVQQLQQMLDRFNPPPPDVDTLPAELKNHLVSSDGYYALYITPRENLWQRVPLARFVNDIERRAASVPNHPPITGVAPEIYHSTRAIQHSFYKATLLALILVVILVLLDLRNVVQTLITVSVLGLGLPVLVGLMGLLGISWNFANFFGLPILIGAGHEYGVFMMHRYREVRHDPRRVWGSWDVSDRALLLCAFVTTSSFAFFWALGHHEGLKSLGLVMALGTACIYLAAVMVVRPLLKWKIEADAARREKIAIISAP
ncbi:MAG TPA: MMPL family transporter [Tepidisphaeraceae bacterium]|nr:MMPL family transporter [Tepidisphaeraceae bacterium]